MNRNFQVSTESKVNKISGFSIKDIFDWITIYVQLFIITGAIYFFHIEEDLGLIKLWYLVLLLFTANIVLPIKYKPFSLILGFFAGLILFLGVLGGIKVLLASLIVIGFCHLPVSYTIRKVMLILIGITVAAMVLKFIPSPLSAYELRVFSTLLMFRIVLYFYEINHESDKPKLITRINYFFQLPNIVFPLFPIVDYQTYQINYYNDQPIKIYQKGVSLILWSLICILIYRYIYQYGIPKLLDVKGVFSMWHFYISTYLSVFRLIGLLSLSVGILRLFGFNLPRIFNNMFLASSFSDLFKRINIYWKDFMTKICYYPVYFYLRKKTPVYAVTISIFVTYLFTWFFHSYQWFWVLGASPFSDNDILFWGVFGVIGTLSIYFESNTSSNQNEHILKKSLIKVAKVIITFLSMCLLYTLWISPTINSWFRILATGLNDSMLNWGLFIGYLLGIWLVASFAYYSYIKHLSQKFTWFQDQKIKSITFSLILVSGAVFFFVWGNSDKDYILFVENTKLNEKDDYKEFTGYYDEILSVRPDVGSKLWSYEHKTDKKENLKSSGILRPSNSVLISELIPNYNTLYKNKKITTNQWGMRDRPYNKVANPNVVRLAIMGSSTVLGSGVADDEVFENIVENWLNEFHGSDSLKFELLNFGVSGGFALQHWYLLENNVIEFDPDYILFFENCRPFRIQQRNLNKIHDRNLPIPQSLDSLFKVDSFNFSLDASEKEKNELGKAVTKLSYQKFMELCIQNNYIPIWAFMPPTSKSAYPEEFIPIAKEAGFMHLFDFSGVYDNYHESLLKVSINDDHPNGYAHKIYATALYQKLEAHLKLPRTNIKKLK